MLSTLPPQMDTVSTQIYTSLLTALGEGTTTRTYSPELTRCLQSLAKFQSVTGVTAIEVLTALRIVYLLPGKERHKLHLTHKITPLLVDLWLVESRSHKNYAKHLYPTEKAVNFLHELDLRTFGQEKYHHTFTRALGTLLDRIDT